MIKLDIYRLRQYLILASIDFLESTHFRGKKRPYLALNQKQQIPARAELENNFPNSLGMNETI